MSIYSQFHYLPAGDSALVVELGDEISPEINQRMRGLVAALEQQPLPGIREYVPTYRSLLIQYDPGGLLFQDVCTHVQRIETQIVDLPLPEPRIVTLPVVYGGSYGPDLDFVAQHAGLTPAEVIVLHAGRDYLVYMLGFTPGFCYLGGLAEQLETPRLVTPRTQIPAGSVGIAGKQTGMYPIESPGGWQLIGRTPVRLFDPSREPVVLIHAGDYVRFAPITEAEYLALATQVEQGAFILHVETGIPQG